jgi:hypothetical protein
VGDDETEVWYGEIEALHLVELPPGETADDGGSLDTVSLVIAEVAWYKNVVRHKGMGLDCVVLKSGEPQLDRMEPYISLDFEGGGGQCIWGKFTSKELGGPVRVMLKWRRFHVEAAGQEAEEDGGGEGEGAGSEEAGGEGAGEEEEEEEEEEAEEEEEEDENEWLAGL